MSPCRTQASAFPTTRAGSSSTPSLRRMPRPHGGSVEPDWGSRAPRPRARACRVGSGSRARSAGAARSTSPSSCSGPNSRCPSASRRRPARCADCPCWPPTTTRPTGGCSKARSPHGGWPRRSSPTGARRWPPSSRRGPRVACSAWSSSMPACRTSTASPWPSASGKNPAARAGHPARCRQLGVARHLVKPLTPSELLNAVLLALGPSPEAESPQTHGGDDASRPLHVLVAEDNTVNQVLIVRLLEKLGHTSFLAGNGEEAVRAYETQVFDVVLMDVQMPVMDGLAATAAIREREARNPGRRRLPIMALPAFALRGDRERCLAAGMDDYLTKPIKPADLAAAMKRLCADEWSVATTAASASGEPAAVEGFDFFVALIYVGGDLALLDELLDIFAEDAPVRMDAIRRAIAGG